MPEYRCVNIGTEGYPVWLTLSEKATIAAVEPTAYSETGQSHASVYVLMTTVTLVVAGCCIEVKSPLPVDSVCRILGFVWDEASVVGKPAPAGHPGRDTAHEATHPEEVKPGGGQ